jgi:hypothetical protein
MFIRMKELLLVLALCVPAMTHAGTIGLSGSWDFDGQLTIYDPIGVPFPGSPVTGRFDFDSGDLDLQFSALFFGLPIIYTGGTISDNGNGTYSGALIFDWSTSTGNVATILWDITDLGNGTASVLTLDGDSDGIPGNAITSGTIAGNSFEINGELTVVPLPASVWLFGSGLLGLVGIVRRKKAA